MTIDFTLDNLNDDTLDIRDIIEYYESLDEDCYKKRFIKDSILDELCDKGSDGLWNGGWYPITLIATQYFEDYTIELARECYNLKESWPYNHIDWSAAAEELLVCYSEININYGGQDYNFYYYYR